MTPSPENPKRSLSDWFPSADNADEAQVPGQRMAAKLNEIRQTLPLPQEQVRTPDHHGLADLAEKLDAAADSTAVIALAHNLSSRELGLIFPLLATLTRAIAPDKSASRQAAVLADRLTLIIRERACHSLYLSGWLAFQLHYPCPPIAQALAILCRILEIKAQTAGYPAEPPLISGIERPDARQFVQRLANYAISKGIYPDRLIDQYQIEGDLPFGVALLAAIFLGGDVAVFQDNHKLFGDTLELTAPELQIEMLHRFLNLPGLPDPVRNRCCQQIYLAFNDPAAGHPIWRQLKPKDRQIYQNWVFTATIGTHCRLQPDKARLYLAYSSAIRRVELWDTQTLLIYFSAFVIADNRQQPDLAICYELTSSDHPFELASGTFNPNPADPAIPRRPIDDAIRKISFAGIIGLPFDRDGIRLSKVFLDLHLKHKHRFKLLP